MNIEKLQENLRRRGISSVFFQTGEEAARYLTAEISKKKVVIGGSKTIEALRLYETLAEENDVFWHWKQNAEAAWNVTCRSDVYLCSANAIAETGEIINIDGRGNRLAGTMFHTREVFYVIGTNKICPTMEEALWRARNIAAPLNARRFGVKTPCSVGELKCHDCTSPERICRELLVTWQKPMDMIRMEVVIIGQALGY